MLYRAVYVSHFTHKSAFTFFFTIAISKFIYKSGILCFEGSQFVKRQSLPTQNSNFYEEFCKTEFSEVALPHQL